MKFRHLLALGLTSCLSIGHALAQGAPPSVANDGLGSDDVPAAGDIIVTARKRQESILKVPVVENVVTAEALSKSQITDISRIVGEVPGLSLGYTSGVIGALVSIRGVGTNAIDAGVDQSVALNIDGVQFSQGAAYRSGMFDLAQAEVLKGPQALFFGKNAPGGVIALTTADPGTQTEIVLRSGYEFEARNWRSEGIVSGPVTPELGLRLAAMYSNDDGFYKNTAIANTALGGQQPPRRFGGGDRIIVRGTAVWKPTSNFSARLKLNYTLDDLNATSPNQYVFCPEGTGGVAPFPNVAFLAGEDCKLDRNIQLAGLSPTAFVGIANKGQEFEHDVQKFVSLEMNLKISPELTLTSTTGYYDIRARNMQNGSVAPSLPTLASQNYLDRHDLTQELRLQSDFVTPLNFTIGAYYQDAKLDARIVGITNTVFNAQIGAPLPAQLFDNSSVVNIETISAFGQGRWKVIPDVELAAGVRFTSEKRNDDSTNNQTDAPIPLVVPKIKSSNWAPEFTVTYTPTDDLTLFGSYKKAYKSGSFSVNRLLRPGDDNSFGDESVSGAEVGLKARSSDRSLFVNFAGYHYKYSGLQVGVSTNLGGPIPVNRTLNASGAKVYGVDLDATFRPRSLEGLSLRAAINWNHARFTDLDGVPCTGGQTVAEGCNQVLNPSTGLYTAQSLTGTPLVRAPTWQATGGAQYDMPLGNYTLSFGSDLQYSSRYKTQLTNRPEADQRAYAKVNANISLKAPDERWELALIGNNLTEKLTRSNCTSTNAQNGVLYGGQITGGTTSGAAGKDELVCFMDYPGRELWIRGSIKF
jgi:outer membrane receptor protein involved in Fe transport